MKIGVIGCGALSHELAANLDKVLPGKFQFAGFLARTASKAEAMASEYGGEAFTDIEAMLAVKPDYIVEMAGVPAVKVYGQRVLQAGISLIVVSIGALADKALLAELEQTALANNSKMYVVNGAVGGFDVLQTIALMNQAKGWQYKKAEIENIKAPGSINGAPYLEGRELSETEEELVFTGNVQEAIAGFPKNVNVAVSSSLAAEADNYEVIIKSVPGLTENKHIIRVDNGMVRAEIGIYSQPDPANPKSSTSTAWSVIALLKNLVAPVVYY